MTENIEDFYRRDATGRVTEIQTCLGFVTGNLNQTADLIREAYKNEDWQTLGFPSWAEYCEKSFHTDMLKTGSGTRRELISRLGDVIGTVDLAALFGVARKTVQRDKGTNVPHMARGTGGDSEWYTPPEIVKAARSVMGGIDLDPASTADANAVIGAKRFYTAQDDGLSQPWKARRVYLNPPYADPLCGKFVTRLIREIREGNIKQAVLLVNSATATNWFQEATAEVSAIAFPRGRVTFWRSDGKDERAGNPQGTAILYFGDNPEKFRNEFIRFGFVVNTGK